MKPLMDPYESTKALAEKFLQNQVINPGDRLDDDGILHCGKCGKPRRRFTEIKHSTTDGEYKTTRMLVTTRCLCEIAAEKKAEEEERARIAMERLNRLKGASLMDRKYDNARFENFKVTQYNERNLKLAKRYAERFDQMLEKNQGLLFWGDTGTGKSWTAACIANYLLEHRTTVMMTSLIKLIDILQKDKDKEGELVDRLNNADLVIFDDFGAERETSYSLEKVYSIINSRYLKRLPMIITTNFTMDQLMHETDMRYKRTYDRLFETCYPMQFTGPSWRRFEANRRSQEMLKLLEDE